MWKRVRDAVDPLDPAHHRQPSLLDEPEPEPEPDVNDEVAALVDRYGLAAVDTALIRIRIAKSGEPIPSAPGRATDPATSQVRKMVNVRRFRRTSYAGRLLNAFAMNDSTHFEATLFVLGEGGSHTQWDGCRRRCSDLVAAGYIAPTGDTRQNPGGSEAEVYDLTPEGAEAWARMVDTGWSC
jgi:hypothetical protein